MGSWSTRSSFSKPVNMPDIGGFVKEELYGLHISVPALAKRLNVSADRAYRLLRRADWRVSEIMNLSVIISGNLFDWYARQTRAPEPAETPAAPPAESPEAELQKLRQRNAVLEAENRLLREMADALKAK